MIKSIKSLLSNEEKILHDSRIHWIVFLKPLIFAIIGILMAIFFHPLVGILILVMNLYPLYIATAFYYTTHLVLTDKKILGRTGYIFRDWVQLNLNQVETAYLEEPILGRMLGYSTILIKGTGTGIVVFPYLLNADAYIKKMEKYISKIQEKENKITILLNKTDIDEEMERQNNTLWRAKPI